MASSNGFRPTYETGVSKSKELEVHGNELLVFEPQEASACGHGEPPGVWREESHPGSFSALAFVDLERPWQGQDVREMGLDDVDVPPRVFYEFLGA